MTATAVWQNKIDLHNFYSTVLISFVDQAGNCGSGAIGKHVAAANVRRGGDRKVAIFRNQLFKLLHS